jgi:hypothetical protein
MCSARKSDRIEEPAPSYGAGSLFRAPDRIRTDNRIFVRDVLYPLSYRGTHRRYESVAAHGIAIESLWTTRANHGLCTVDRLGM